MAGDWGESGEGVDDALTRAIIEAIIKGSWLGFGEAIDRRALVVELKKQNIFVATNFDRPKPTIGGSSPLQPNHRPIS
jgi:hypothetical protein